MQPQRSELERLGTHLRRHAPPASDPPADERSAAVAMVLRSAARGLDVLLMRRSEHPEDRWSGHISLPGGHAEDGDEDLLATAVRETREEVGVRLEAGPHLLGRLAPVQAKARGRVLSMRIAPFVFASPAGAEPTPGPEAQEVFWFPLWRAQAGELDDVHRLQHEGVALKLPSWRFDDRVIWGLTHEMLSALLRAVRGAS